MGRYYDTSTGREGKFMFATQDSTDPQYLGMRENQNFIEYYADTDDVENITAKLNEQYDILDVPEKDRIYLLPSENVNDDEAMERYENEVLWDKVFESFHHGDLHKAHKKYGKKATHWGSKNGDEYVDFERKDGRALALARVRLALIILTDIAEEGYCELRAET